MRILVSLLLMVTLTACEWSSGNDDEGYTCSNRDQKRFVRDAADYWYLWNDLLPKKVKVSKYDTAVDLLVDRSGLKGCGQGEWHSRTHGDKTRKRRRPFTGEAGQVSGAGSLDRLRVAQSDAGMRSFPIASGQLTAACKRPGQWLVDACNNAPFW